MKSQGFPKARIVRRNLAPDNTDHMDGGITALMMQFGQFVAHDLSLIPSYRLCEYRRTKRWVFFLGWAMSVSFS